MADGLDGASRGDKVPNHGLGVPSYSFHGPSKDSLTNGADFVRVLFVGQGYEAFW